MIAKEQKFQLESISAETSCCSNSPLNPKDDFFMILKGTFAAEAFSHYFSLECLHAQMQNNKLASLSEAGRVVNIAE